MTPEHRLSGTIDGDTAAMSCPDCSYGFIAPAVDGRIDFTRRMWFDRGDRSANHVFMRDGVELSALVAGEG